MPDLAAGGEALRRDSTDRLLFRDHTRRGRRRELGAAAPPVSGTLASRHLYGRWPSDGRALLVVLVFEGRSIMIFKRLDPVFAYLQLDLRSTYLQLDLSSPPRQAPVDSPKNRRATAR